MGVLFLIDFFCLFVSLFIYLYLFFFVSKITRKRPDRFAWNFQRRRGVTMGRPDSILGQFKETERCCNAQHGEGVCCALAPQLVNFWEFKVKVQGQNRCTDNLPLAVAQLWFKISSTNFSLPFWQSNRSTYGTKYGVFPFRLIPIRLIPFRLILGLGLLCSPRVRVGVRVGVKLGLWLGSEMGLGLGWG